VRSRSKTPNGYLFSPVLKTSAAGETTSFDGAEPWSTSPRVFPSALGKSLFGGAGRLSAPLDDELVVELEPPHPATTNAAAASEPQRTAGTRGERIGRHLIARHATATPPRHVDGEAADKVRADEVDQKEGAWRIGLH
jgi:hypothetical protein